MKHAFHPEGFTEYVAAASAYEAGQPGLGSRFIQSVESAIEGICRKLEEASGTVTRVEVNPAAALSRPDHGNRESVDAVM